MATLTVTVTPESYDTVSIYGAFSGGDEEYVNYRMLDITFSGGAGAESTSIRSVEGSGGSATFFGSASGLTPGAQYTWRAVVQYWDGNDWIDSASTASGYIEMPFSGWIVYNSEWRKYVQWIFYNGWKMAKPWVMSGTWKSLW